MKGRTAGVHMLTQVMSGIMRGEMGMAMQSMRNGLHSYRSALELEDLQSRNESQVCSAAIREMRALLWRMVKGHVSMRLEVCAGVSAATTTRRVPRLGRLRAACVHAFGCNLQTTLFMSPELTVHDP